MAGIVTAAMGGLGEGLMKSGAQLGEHASRSALQEEAAAIQKQRDATLAEMQERYTIRAEDRARTRSAAVGTEAEAARTGLVDDPSGTVRARNQLEGSEAEAGVYRKHGLVNEAMRVQDSERSRQERAEDRLDRRSDRTADNARADKQLTEQARHNKAMEGNAAASNSRLKELTDLQMKGLRFELEGKQELRTMQTDFEKETDPAKRATLERNILSRLGKAKEIPEPVKLYVDTVNGVGCIRKG